MQPALQVVFGDQCCLRLRDTMPLLVDCDPLGNWHADVTPIAALVSAPAYCLVYEGRGQEDVVPVTLSEQDAQLLLNALPSCDERFFGMEVGGLRAAPCYAAAFSRENRLMSLIYYNSFRENGAIKPTQALAAHTIYRIVERILAGHSDIDACYIPLALTPPRHFVSDSRGRREVFSFPKVKQQTHRDGVLLRRDTV